MPTSETGPDSAWLDLAEALTRVARTLENEPDLEQTISAIVAAAAATVPGVEHAGVSLLERGGRIRSVGASTELIAELNTVEHELGEGPCVDAVEEQHVYRTGDLAHDDRWPHFGPAAAKLGVTSMLGYRLYTDTRTLGSLDLYSTRPDAFDDEAERIGGFFAGHAAVAVATMQRQEHLRVALDTRDVIATAKGILMGRDRRTEQQAFELLVRASQDTNMKLRDVALWLVSEANAAAEKGRG